MKQNLKEKLVGGILAMLFAFSPAVLADDASGAQTAAMVGNLQKQMATMQKTIDAQNGKIRNLENRGPAAAGGAVMTEPTPPMSDYEFNQRLETSLGGANKWLKDLSFKGDVRLRYEAFNNTSGRTPSGFTSRSQTISDDPFSKGLSNLPAVILVFFTTPPRKNAGFQLA